MSLGNQGVFLDIKSGKLGSETKGTTAKIKEIRAMTAILALMLTILFLGPNAARLALLQLFDLGTVHFIKIVKAHVLSPII